MYFFVTLSVTTITILYDRTVYKITLPTSMDDVEVC